MSVECRVSEWVSEWVREREHWMFTNNIRVDLLNWAWNEGIFELSLFMVCVCVSECKGVCVGAIDNKICAYAMPVEVGQVKHRPRVAE